MPKRLYKYKLLLDENLPPRQRLPRLNKHYDVKHVRDDLHRGGSEDPSVYRLAVAQGRILVTENWSDSWAQRTIWREGGSGVTRLSAIRRLPQVGLSLRYPLGGGMWLW